MVDLLLDAAAPYAFSAHRPPGHHALPSRAMGFCLFNNIAVAAQYALDARGLERVMIVDWDVHHGNGTNDIFHASDRVLFVSIHQSPLYPGTGAAADVGSGDGRGFTVNLPVPPGADDRLFCSLVDHVAVPLARSFAPQLLLVSAGYDAHSGGPARRVPGDRGGVRRDDALAARRGRGARGPGRLRARGRVRARRARAVGGGDAGGAERARAGAGARH